MATNEAASEVRQAAMDEATTDKLEVSRRQHRFGALN